LDEGNTVCYSSMPITVQASLRARKLALHSNRSYGYAFRSRAALTNASPPVSPGGEMITLRFGSTKDFAKEWNNRVYCRLSKMLCGFKDQVRARPSGETGGLCPAPAPVILVRNAGLIQFLIASVQHASCDLQLISRLASGEVPT
jgi:hypothetical protein